MKTVLFILATLGLAALRVRMGQGFPDFLAAWLVVVAFYGEGSRGVAQAGWIGLLHGFPTQTRLEGFMAIGIYLILRAERFHIGRDSLLSRTLSAALTCLCLCLPGLLAFWWEDHAKLLATFGLLTGILSIPMFSIGRNWGHWLGLRPRP